MQLISNGPADRKRLIDVQHVVQGYMDTVLGCDRKERGLGSTEGNLT